MTGHRRLATASAAALLALCGCTVGDPPVAVPSPAAPVTTRPPQPPAEGGPRLVVRAAVDLSPGTGGPSALAATGAVATADGGAHVVLAPAGGEGPLALVTVDGAGAVVRSVPVPPLAQVFGVHLLAGGEVLVSGQLPRPGREYGFVAVDPVSGAARTVVAVPYEDGTVFSFGRSALSADGSTLFLFVALAVEARTLDLLVAVDPRSGAFLGGRDLFEEVREISGFPVATHSGGLLPRPDGGVTLVFDSWVPTAVPDGPVPGLLSYDAALEPLGDPRRLDVGGEGGDVQAAAAGPDGMLYLTVQPRSGNLLVAVRGSRTQVVGIGGHAFDDSLAVDPAGRLAVLPGPAGARGIDLATGAAGVLDVGCAAVEPVARVVPGAGPTLALLLGRCAAGRPALWLVGT
ncbi:hypothetical protein ACI797_27060 [Geodermatophilus sp. SYSU D00691]